MAEILRKISLRLIPAPYREDPLTKASLYKWLLIGLLIRLVLMPITVYFPDLLSVYWRSALIAYYGIHWVGGAQNFIHYVHAFFLWIFRPLMPYFDSILYDPQMRVWATEKMFDTFIIHPQVFRTLFLFKVPYLLFDLGCAFLLLSIVQDRKKGIAAFVFWLLNPIVLFATYIAARYEVISTFFILWGLYYAKDRSFVRSGLCLGMSVITRLYPLLLLPFFIVILANSLWEKAKLAFWGLVPFGAMVALARLFHQTTEVEHLLKLRHTIYLLQMRFYLGQLNDHIFIFPLLYTLLLVYTFFRTDHSFTNLWKIFLVVLLLYFSTCFFHPHYFMWLIPFITLQVIEDRRFLGLFVIQVIGFIVYTFQWQQSFAGYLFAPIDPSYFMNIRTPYEIIDQYYPANQFIGVVRTIFSAVSFWMIYLLFKEFFSAKKGEGR